jgi:hypothetical protein
MRRTCCLRLTPPRGARLQKHSQDPNCQFQNPADTQARFALPAHGIRTSFTRSAALPARRGQSFNLSASLRPVNPSAFTTFSLSQNQPRAELLQSTRVIPNRQGAFFQTFPSTPPPPPFRRQPYKLSACPSPVNPCAEPASASLRPVSVRGAKYKAPDGAGQGVCFVRVTRAARLHTGDEQQRQNCLHAEDAGGAEERGGNLGARTGMGRRSGAGGGGRYVGVQPRGRRETRAGGSILSRIRAVREAPGAGGETPQARARHLPKGATARSRRGGSPPPRRRRAGQQQYRWPGRLRSGPAPRPAPRLAPAPPSRYSMRHEH